MQQTRYILILQKLNQGIRILLSSCGGAVRLDLNCAGVHSLLQLLCSLRTADMPQQHGRSLDDGSGVGVFAHAALNHTGSRAVDSFKHGILVADVGAACGTYTALDLSSFIGNDVAIEVGQQHHLELFPERLLSRLAVIMSM